MKNFILILLICLLQIGQVHSSVRIALPASPGSLNPFFSFSAYSQNILRLVHLSLIEFDQNMQVVCNICTRYNERFEKNKYIIEFELKKGLKFQNGSEVTVSDVENSLNYFTSDKIKSPFRFAFNKIKKFKSISPYKFELHYSSYSISALSDLFLLKIVQIPKFKQKNEIGLSDIVAGGKYSLGKQTAFKIPLVPVSGIELLPLTFLVVKDETTLAMKLIHSELDLALSIPSPRKLNFLRRKIGKSYKFLEAKGTNYEYIAPNHQRKFLSDRRVRKALSLLIPRKELLNFKLGNSVSLAGSFFSSSFDTYHQSLPIDAYDLDRAKELLSEAGFKQNSQGWLELSGEPFVIDFKVTNSKQSIEFVRTIIPYFEAAGIRVKLTSLEWGTFKKMRARGDFDLILGSWVGFKDADILEFALHSDKIPPRGGNRGRFLNQKFDKFINKAVQEKSRNKRIQYFKRAQKIAKHEYAYISLWHPKIIWLVRKCFSNIYPYGNGSFNPLLRLKSNCQ